MRSVLLVSVDSEPVTGGWPGALTGLRVLELGTELTHYCGKMFAELGADVVLVEPPEGSPLRDQPPFVDDEPGPENSLQFFYRNTSKRGIVVDLAARDSGETIRRLAAGADLILDGLPPGRLEEIGAGPASLIEQNPELVVTSISPFGQTGPYAHYAHSDLVCMALGGLLWMGGYTDGPPVRAFGDQAYMAGNLFGAVASMVALTHAEIRGQGQHVDVSVQEAVVMGLENAAQYYDLEKHVRRRYGGEQRQAGFGVFPCADGHVFLLAAGLGGDRYWGKLVDWMLEEGIAGADRLLEDRWTQREYMYTDEAKNEFWKVFTSFSLDHRKEDLYHESQKRGVPLGPVNRPSDVLESAQLRHRGYFEEMQAFGRSFRIPGAPYRLSATPWRMTGPAPRLGEHTDEVLVDFGFTGPEIERLRETGAVR
ncbi:MAG TPA: CaiB/BaiF CoA-transferase family protein [Acidimicrobiia bacterium]|nr:CaiB/BaiF CoA-transferase family protein [Acidimicrobiia bacterium]